MALRKSAAFCALAPNSNSSNFVNITCAEFYQNVKKNVQNMSEISRMPINTIRLPLHWTSRNVHQLIALHRELLRRISPDLHFAKNTQKSRIELCNNLLEHRAVKLWTCLCILYNQRDATYTVFFIIISALHVSGGFFAHHQEFIKLYVQPWVLSAVYR